MMCIFQAELRGEERKGGEGGRECIAVGERGWREGLY